MIEKYREYHLIRGEQELLQDTGYAPILYTDHYSDGRQAQGTEDFSLERWNCSIVQRAVYRPTGKLNKGGQRCWEHIRTVRAASFDSCYAIIRLLYGGQEIRTRAY